MLEVKHLSAGYNGDNVICNISFTAERNKCLCIIGPNGCGKSTLLKSIAHLMNYNGSITLDEKDISTFSKNILAVKIAFLEQSPAVYFSFSVYDVVSMGRYPYSAGFLKDLSAEDESIIENIMKELDIWDLRKSMIDEISGGQAQRVFLARTLAQGSDVILLDEPTKNLDIKYQIELMTFLKSWINKNDKILIAVFHDLNLAGFFGDNAILLKDKNIAAKGTVQEVLNSETLQAAYGIDIRKFMADSLEKWK